MKFSGYLYFDFVSEEVYWLYRLLVAAQQEGATLELEWRAFSGRTGALDRPALAAGELIRHESPEHHGGFIQAMLAAVHLEGTSPDESGLVELAGRVAGISADLIAPERLSDEGEKVLQVTEAEARNLGVSAVPTFYRHGPVMRVRTTPAVDQGDPLARLALIDAVLEDDGLWELAKP